MRLLLAAVIASLALFGCGVGVDDDGPEAGTALQPLLRNDLPPQEHPQLKSPLELFGQNPTLDPYRQSFQQQFAYTVDVPH